MNIPVTVIGQKMILDTGQSILAPGSQQFIKFVFDLSEDWSGLNVFAQWTQNGESYNTYLSADDSVFLPSEIGHGSCVMTLYGTGDGGIIGTTLPLNLYIKDNCFVADAQSTVITQSLYDQMMEAIRGIATLAETREYLGIE